MKKIKIEKFILKYKNEFGIIMTSQYRDQKELEFWKGIRMAQGYEIIN